MLYPLGVAGELMSTYYAWTEIRKLDPSEKPFTVRMPNELNVAFDFEKTI